MRLPSTEYWRDMAKESPLRCFHPFQLKDHRYSLCLGKHSIWIYRYTSRKKTVGATTRLWHNSELRAWLSTLAVCGYKSRVQSNLKKNPSKVIVTEEQVSLSRYHETTEIWRFDSWLQNAFLLCLRIARNNISPFDIGKIKDQEGHMCTHLHWFLGSIQHLMNHWTKKETEGTLDTLTEADLKLCMTASFWQVTIVTV